MIRFRSKIHKILFSVIAPIVIIGTFVLLYLSFNRPEERDPSICMGSVMCILLPAVVILLFIATFFTVPSKPNSSPVLTFFWGLGLAGLSFLCFSIYGFVQFTTQRAERCDEIKPNKSLWSCDFSGEDLSNLDLSGADLSDANLSKANLTGVNFMGANLTGANLSGADLTDVSFERAILNKADLSDTIGLTNDILSGIASWQGIIIENRQNIYTNLAPACLGDRVRSAAPYTEDYRVHPLVLLDQDGKKHELSDRLPLEWWPPFTSYTQLVACTNGETDVLIQTCSYENGGKALRYVKEAVVRIVEASTGEVVKEIVVRGDEPRQCPQKLTSYGDSSPEVKYVGRSLGSYDYTEALSKFVNPNGEIESLRIPSSE